MFCLLRLKLMIEGNYWRNLFETDRAQQSRPPRKFECSFAGCTKSYNARSYLVEHERQVFAARIVVLSALS